MVESDYVFEEPIDSKRTYKYEKYNKQHMSYDN